MTSGRHSVENTVTVLALNKMLSLVYFISEALFQYICILEYGNTPNCAMELLDLDMTFL